MNPNLSRQILAGRRDQIATTCRYFAMAIAALALLMALLRYHNLEASIFDLGVYDHLAWRFAAYGDWLPTLTGHFRPITLLYGLAYKIAPHPFTLITLQWLAAVAAGVLFYRITRHLLDAWHADVLIALYALNPIVLYQVFWDFHADHLIVLTFFAIFHILVTRESLATRHRLAIASLCVVSWLFKEPLVLSVAFMGLFIAVYKKEWKLGLGVFASSLLFFYLITQVIWPFLREGDIALAGGYENLHSAFSYLGSSIPGALRTLITEPSTVVGALFNDIGKAYYLAALLLPVAFLPLLSPAALLSALPAIAISLLSTNPNHYAPVHHYTASIVAPLYLGMVFTLMRYNNGGKLGFMDIPLPKTIAATLAPKRIAVALAVGTVFVSWAYSPLPFSRFFFMETSKYHYSASVPDPRDRTVKARIDETIPAGDDVSVSIQNNVMYHPLLQRREYHLFPRGLDEADYAVLDTTKPPYVVDRLQPEEYQHLVEALRGKAQILVDEDGLLIFRVGKVAAPPETNP